MRRNVASARAVYVALDYDPIPLVPDGKAPHASDWPTVPPAKQWRDAPADANIALRCGGGLRLAVLDADDDAMPGTAERIARYLAGMGIDAGDCPTIATPSGGRHFYVRFTRPLSGNARNLSPDMGKGELRFGCGAYVAAPPSTIGQARYQLTAGDWRQLPPIDPRDLLPIVPTLETSAQVSADTPARARFSRRAWALLSGEGIDRYPSRSEAEQAVITSLINSGFDFPGILSLFIRYPAGGKFAELYAASPKRAEAYLRHSFGAAARYASAHTSPARQMAAQAIAWASARAWPGRTGATDRAVFLAHANIAHTAGATLYAAPCRTLAELAQVDKLTASRATHRLVTAGMLAVEKPATATLSTVFRLSPALTTAYTSIPLPVRKCTHVAFRGDKTAGQVWGELQSGALSVAELAERTGRGTATIARALARMARIVDARTGEVWAIVTREGETWRACEGADLEAVARANGAADAAERQRQRHAEERRERKEIFGSRAAPREEKRNAN
ncbi:MAG: bifunctional DNA primase/polymerase [Chloroflexi bacterium]|nr:bifunctional DNA primase/polymerase [Chloroflexota bacterium]